MQNPKKMPVKAVSNKVQTNKRPLLKNLYESLGILFFLIWILIGLFFILFIVANFRQGTFKYLFGSSPQTQEQVQAPTEAPLSGIGKVNIACVQEALSEEAIQKIITEKSTSSLTDEEKTKFEPCVVEKESPASSPSPKQ
jgi:hypothetical protein